MAVSYNGVPLPSNGTPIQFANGRFQIADNPIIPFIEGDGTGRDIWKASQRVFDAAVQKAYGGKRRVVWYEVFAGEKAFAKFNSWLPDDTIKAIRDLHISIKRPLTTPGGGPLIEMCRSRMAVIVSSGSQLLNFANAFSPAKTSYHTTRRFPPYAFCTAR